MAVLSINTDDECGCMLGEVRELLIMGMPLVQFSIGTANSDTDNTELLESLSEPLRARARGNVDYTDLLKSLNINPDLVDRVEDRSRRGLNIKCIHLKTFGSLNLQYLWNGSLQKLILWDAEDNQKLSLKKLRELLGL